jgi:hypothetical protein
MTKILDYRTERIGSLLDDHATTLSGSATRRNTSRPQRAPMTVRYRSRRQAITQGRGSA